MWLFLLYLTATECLLNYQSRDTVFCAPNNMFMYKTVHLKFCALQIVLCAHMHANVYLAVHLLQRQKYFRV